MSAIYKSEEGQRLVESRYRELLTRWPVPSEQRSIPTSFGDTFTSTARRQYVRELADGGARRPWPGARIDDGRIAGRVARAGLRHRGTSTSRSPRARKYCRHRPREGQFVIKTLALMLMGRWGRRKAFMLAVGPLRANPDVVAIEIARFAGLIAAHFKHRRERVPIFTDEALRRLKMPVLAIAGAQDALLDSEGTRRRLAAQVKQAAVRMLPDAGHVIRGETEAIKVFLADLSCPP